MNAPLQSLSIEPITAPLKGKVVLPGSKSVTNRVLLLAGLARGTSRLTGALKSDDTLYMAQALRQMGVSVEQPDATSFIVRSTGALQAPDAPLFLGNAGTAVRFLTAASALVRGTVVVGGDANMARRPIAPLVAALQRLGIDATAPSGCPPVTIHGTGLLDGGEVEIDASLSSQYVSALLMMAGCSRRPVRISLSGPHIGAQGYIGLTIAAMKAFGASVASTDDTSWTVAPGGYTATDFRIEPDASAATYLWAAQALSGGDIDIGFPIADFTQPDAAAWRVIRSFPHMPAVIDGSQMQDAIPTLAVMAMFNATPVRFVGIANLRVKECDRTHALATQMQRINPGYAREEGDDLLVFPDPDPSATAKNVRIETYDDHRIAMSFALAALKIPGLSILNPGCVAKTFPAYWDTLRALGVRIHPGD
ncbi:3-phosphoshikimate 1-carboxyvinyltransferase [Novacetimonas cocois]|uniref:3-phosphoshikimate 1-carboxyvinyltransferase n=1 Tax=Novacetimonas cocois TaxID=1747507 RepID=A0A365YRH3_9PROT|nr:3-phosphoshikimate 1-carboxyvinyltransferase [Novacetimonas cocois]RBM05387.1 3-phosphoshikimate 1-carboxyvinyltransferase [Novacetimonas cocois]